MSVAHHVPFFLLLVLLALLASTALVACPHSASKAFWSIIMQASLYGLCFLSVVVKESVASEVIQATCFSGSATVTWSSRSGLSDTVPIGVQLRVLPLHRAGLASRAA